MWRGTDWFVFKGDLIQEIRQYDPAPGLQSGQDVELVGSSYAERRYPTKETLGAELP